MYTAMSLGRFSDGFPTVIFACIASMPLEQIVDQWAWALAMVAILAKSVSLDWISEGTWQCDPKAVRVYGRSDPD